MRRALFSSVNYYVQVDVARCTSVDIPLVAGGRAIAAFHPASNRTAHVQHKHGRDHFSSPPPVSPQTLLLHSHSAVQVTKAYQVESYGSHASKITAEGSFVAFILKMLSPLQSVLNGLLYCNLSSDTSSKPIVAVLRLRPSSLTLSSPARVRPDG
ncbi:unnamed protein product [Heligmosomoides polygyrus]|uniref:Uncharacterized protein n=1 Tax=Heligmosomoides polygyrus TaxID=6339 RepID=A0A183GD30_HELPZ|nr:unnamed protein product [Heligmosomoides polygyrus]